MLGLEEAENPKSLQNLVDEVVAGGFIRTPHDVAYEKNLTGLALAITPIRSLVFEPMGGNGTVDDQKFAVTTRTNNIISGDGLSLLRERADNTTETKDSR